MGYRNPITFIGLVSTKNYFERPRIIKVIALGWERTGWNKFGRAYPARVRRELPWTGTAIVHRFVHRSIIDCLLGGGAHNFLWQLVAVRDSSNTEIMLNR